MSQPEKILQLHSEGGWICGNTYRANYIFSHHKRQGECAERYNKTFEFRPCVHGSKNVRDYYMRNKAYEGEYYLHEYGQVVSEVAIQGALI